MKVEKVQRHTLKILSVLVAVLLWFYVLNSEPIEIEKKLTINYILPKGMMMVSFSSKEVTVKLKGSKAFVTNIFSKNEMFNVDLNSNYLTSGNNFSIKFLSSSLDLPMGVEVLDINPKETLIELDQKGITELPIKVQMFGEMPKERKLKEMHLIPETMKISGPIEILKTMSKIETVPMNMSLLVKDEGTLILQLMPLDPRIKNEDNVKLKFIYKTKKVF